jgi:hypothetical protein
MKDWVFLVFMGTWGVLAIVGFALFHLKRDAAFKQRYFPLWLAFTGVVFLSFVYAAGAPSSFLALAVPAIILIALLNIRGTTFCQACGRTTVQAISLSRASHCSKCGAPLTKGR